MKFYIYENWRAHGHTMRIHVGSCSFCRDGTGIHRETRGGNGKWHGPFDSYQNARSIADRSQAQVSDCRFCSPGGETRENSSLKAP